MGECVGQRQCVSVTECGCETARKKEYSKTATEMCQSAPVM